MLPPEFIQRIKIQLGEKEAAGLISSLEAEAPVSVRINTAKIDIPDTCERVSWCETGIYLPSRPVFAGDPLWHAGAYYVQEASSMVLDHILRFLSLPEHPLVLDLCAAPGGKSTLTAAALPQGFIVANETIKSRANILEENIIRWGSGNLAVTNVDPAIFGKLDAVFDLMIVDAPCSGEGLFRKDLNARKEWSPDLVNLCSGRQKRILNDALPSLKDGGILIYSTCTYAEEEDEQNVRWMQDNGFELLSLPVPEGVVDSGAGWHFYPHRVRGEGFFVAVLQKTGNSSSSRPPKPFRDKSSNQKQKFKPELRSWLKGDWNYDLQNDGIIRAIPAFTGEMELDSLRKYFRYFGISLAEVIRDDAKPQHAAAMASALDKSLFPNIELGYDEALKYLAREDFGFKDFDTAWALITFRDIPLGWVKKAGNRLNNYYPKEWRLFSKMSELWSLSKE